MNATVLHRSSYTHNGETISCRTERGATLYSWRGEAWAKTGFKGLEYLCDAITDWQADAERDEPRWTTCSCCGHPLALESAIHHHNSYDYLTHEGACERDFRDA